MDVLPESSRAREVVLVHSSDLHVDEDRIAASCGIDGTAGLRSVLATAWTMGADIILLAGDTFESNQLGYSSPKELELEEHTVMDSLRRLGFPEGRGFTRSRAFDHMSFRLV